MNITFRPIRKSDLGVIVKWLNDSEANQYLGASVRQGTNFDVRLKWYEKYKTEKTKKMFIISIDSKPIGEIGLINIDKLDNNAELFIMIGEKEFRGKGVGEQAVKFVADYGFKKLNLHRISLGCFEENVVAIKCYEKSGFVKEGINRECLYKDGKYCNEIRMGLINDR
jgi:RimJ/RimL family protein N-acetyltransferase